jgi:hypothetical protein
VSLFNDAVSTSVYIVLKVKITEKYVGKHYYGSGRDLICGRFYSSMSGWTEENHETLQSRWEISELRFEHGYNK